MKTLFLLVFLSVFPAYVYGQTYPLTCRGGGSMQLSIERGNYGVAGAAVVGTYQRGQVARRPRPSQCVWDDRAVGSGEPNRFCLQINEQNLMPSGVPGVLGALGGGGQVRLQVYNNRAGCMLVTQVNQVTTSSPQRNNVTIEEIREAVAATGGRHSGDDKSDQVTGPATQPYPAELSRPLRDHSQGLQQIARAVLIESTFREVADYESSFCGGNAFCSSVLWQKAIALQLGVR